MRSDASVQRSRMSAMIAKSSDAAYAAFAAASIPTISRTMPTPSPITAPAAVPITGTTEPIPAPVNTDPSIVISPPERVAAPSLICAVIPIITRDNPTPITSPKAAPAPPAMTAPMPNPAKAPPMRPMIPFPMLRPS